ncbi:MAG: hypothetical protein AAFZ18_07915 [Myxococcota bacterium]
MVAVSSEARQRRTGEQELSGTLRRAYELDGCGSCCVLVTDEGEVFRLNTFAGDEQDWSGLDESSRGTLSRFQSQLVRVRYREREDSVFGASLWGVTVEAL